MIVRDPQFIPLARGWEWVTWWMSDKKSTRWITNGKKFRCTDDGFETTTRRGVAGHNSGHTKRTRRGQ